MSRERNEAAARRYVQALHDKDISVIEELYASDATMEDPVGSDPIVGIQAILEFYRLSGLPALRSAEMTGPVRCVENGVAFPFRLTFMNDGDETLQNLDVIDTFEFDETGRVISMKAYWG